MGNTGSWRSLAPGRGARRPRARRAGVRSYRFALARGQCAGHDSGRRRAFAQLRWHRGPAGSDQGWSLRKNVQTRCKLIFWCANLVQTPKMCKHVQTMSKQVLCKPCANRIFFRSEQTMCKLCANYILIYGANNVQTEDFHWIQTLCKPCANQM